MPEYNSWNLSDSAAVVGIGGSGRRLQRPGRHAPAKRAAEHQPGGSVATCRRLGPAVLNSQYQLGARPGRWHRQALPDIQRLGGAGAASVSAVLRHRHLVRRRATTAATPRYHAGIIKVEKRYSSRPDVPDVVRVLEDVHRFRHLLGYGQSARGRPVQPRGWRNPSGSSTSPTTSSWAWSTTSRSARDVRYLTSGIASTVLGGWRVSSIQYYASGRPIGINSGIDLPISPNVGIRQAATITTYDNWRGAMASGSFDPNPAAPSGGDRFLQPRSFFPAQPTDRVGNSTRANPKLREFPNYNENISVGKTFQMHEAMRVDFRWEAFNLLNRVRFGTGPRTLTRPELRPAHIQQRPAQYTAHHAVRSEVLLLTATPVKALGTTEHCNYRRGV